MASVRLSGITKRYGDSVEAVQELDLAIEDGEFLGLLGPSGSGKTTLLRIIAGLELPTSGQVWFGEEPVVNRSPQERNVAMVFEQNALYPHMTAWQNISYPLRIKKLPKPAIEAKVDEVAELLGIAHLLQRRPVQMSGGQQQRVAVARALVRDPSVLCMDEPIAHLDANMRARLRGELKHLQKSLGTTSVMVTHDPLEAMTMTDRIAVLHDGVLQQVGSPEEIHARPANAFVARFFGLHTMNQLRVADLQDVDGRMVGKFGEAEVQLPTAMRDAVGDRREVLLGIRPENVLVRREASSEDQDAIRVPGNVYVSEPLGDDHLLRVQAGGQLVQSIGQGPANIALDERVSVALPTRKLFVFDADQEEATLVFPEQDHAPASGGAGVAL